MKKFGVLLPLAVLPLLLTADFSEAGGRRHRRSCPMPCPVPWEVVCPASVTPVTPVERFVSPKGRAYRISITSEPRVPFERRAPLPPDATQPGPDDYVGHDRGKAKTS